MSLALASRPKGSGAFKLGAALLAGWFLVAVPPARRALVESLRPALEAILPSAPTLTVADLRARRMELNGQTVLFVEGVLHYAGAKSRKAPGLKLALVGDDGRPLYAWAAKAARSELAPGADVAFQTRLAAPPESFKSITVAFDAP